MKKIFSLLLICCFIFITGCSSNGFTTIDSNKAMELINNGAIVVDVRTSDEYNREHIKDSVNINVDLISSIDYDKDKVIIVYCQTGRRSEIAAKSLVDLGYNNIYNLDGGLINWGFDLVS